MIISISYPFGLLLRSFSSVPWHFSQSHCLFSWMFSFLILCSFSVSLTIRCTANKTFLLYCGFFHHSTECSFCLTEAFLSLIRFHLSIVHLISCVSWSILKKVLSCICTKINQSIYYLICHIHCNTVYNNQCHSPATDEWIKKQRLLRIEGMFLCPIN